MLVPPARAAPGVGCSAPDSAGLHSRECYRPEDTKAGKQFRVAVLFRVARLARHFGGA